MLLRFEQTGLWISGDQQGNCFSVASFCPADLGLFLPTKDKAPCAGAPPVEKKKYFYSPTGIRLV